MNRLEQFVLIALVSASCNKNNFASGKNTPPPPPIPQTCQNTAAGSWQTATQTLTFPAGAGCTWGSSGQKNGYFSGVKEEKQSITAVPTGTDLCSLKIDSEAQDFLYDDYIAFMFDRFVVLSSNSGMINLLDKNPEGLFMWDFNNKVSGKDHEITKDDPPYCIGQSTCSIPTTDNPGNLSLAIDGAAMIQLTKSAAVNEFTLATVGDNDDKNDQDCQHTDLTLKLTISYMNSSNPVPQGTTTPAPSSQSQAGTTGQPVAAPQDLPQDATAP
ncbi:MAG: hypothetical protein AB7T49_06860 [Oligoflexales bacterium]